MNSMSIDRRGRGAAAALVALLALCGCSSPGADDAGAATTLVPAAEGATVYPLTLQTWAGETVLTERPERIAVVGFSSNMDFVEALGVTPVYAVTEDAAWPWRDQNWLAGIEVTDTVERSAPINVEGIAATEPDLIIALNSIYEQNDFDRLTDVAPVLEWAEQEADKADWREGQRLVGEALDLSASAASAVERAETTIASTASSHPEFAGHTVTIAYDYGPEWGLEYYTPTGGTAEGVLLDLGFDPNPLAENFVTEAKVADENLALLDADALVMVYSDEQIRTARETQPLFQQIPAVAEGRYVSLTYGTGETEGDVLYADGTVASDAAVVWVLRRGASPLSLPWAVEALADRWFAPVPWS